ncbi:MAG: nucleotidyltransferase [Clostridium thermopalmarium]|uniref:nucleotidyltransferase n=1 Tax=Clostridium thermopalmarium TaxID=29373 RepID=UPI002352F4E7|nr:nucleotidyltransferase [Clostridium thermopalmarium]MBE6044125.1 nucleotidyltransferase [Clostridium thermopalmarium]
MNLTAIIAEYNPLHMGHLYHIESAKNLTNCDGIICVMSGNFTQRGIPSIISKWDRAKTALNCGVDLVIELPLIYSLSSAEFFAFGAVSLLNNLGIVNNLCFGSESGNIKSIYKIASVLYEEPEIFKDYLKSYLNKGLSYPAARSKALSHIFKKDLDIIETLKHPNNILAIEYCKSLIKLDSAIVPYTIKRIGSSYNNINLEKQFSSATSIRNHLKNKGNIELLMNTLPSSSYNILYTNYNNKNLAFEESIFNYIKYKALTSKNNLENLPDVSEGIHNKLYSALSSSSSYEELINTVKSKRYTYSRISRILCQYFIGLEEYNTAELRKLPAQYARILGFNNRGREILREIKRTASIPIYTKLPKNLNTMLQIDVQGTKSYSIINKSISFNSDFTISPIRLF